MFSKNKNMKHMFLGDFPMNVLDYEYNKKS